MVFLAKTRMCQYQLPSIGSFMYTQLVDHSLDITTGILVDFAFCVKHDIFSINQNNETLMS